MKKIAMTICGVVLMSMMAFAQGIDSTNNRNESTQFKDNPIQDSAFNQPTSPQPIEGVPQTQDATSPIVQPLPQQQSQPQIQSQPQLQSEPQQQQQPLQDQQQAPTQTQPILDRNSPTQQNELNQPVQPTPSQPRLSPTPTDPTGGGSGPKK